MNYKQIIENDQIYLLYGAGKTVKIPLASTMDQFREIGLKYFGIQLRISEFTCGLGDSNSWDMTYHGNASYKLENTWNSMETSMYWKWNKYFIDTLGGYYRTSYLLNEMIIKPQFGELYCGGIAGSSYGQTWIKRDKTFDYHRVPSLYLSWCKENKHEGLMDAFSKDPNYKRWAASILQRLSKS